MNFSESSENHEQLTKLRLYCCFALTLLWLSFPIFSIIPIVIYITIMPTSKSELNYYFFLLALVPGLINYTKLPAEDLLIYNRTYRELYSVRLMDFYTVISADYFFYFISAAISKIFDGREQYFVLFWTTISYYVYFLTLHLCARSMAKYDKRILIGTVVYSLFIGLSFTLSGHLIRQFAAASFLVYAIVLFSLQNRNFVTILAISIFCHFSAMIFIFGFIFNKISKRTLIVLLISLMTASLLIGQFNILELIAPALGRVGTSFFMQEIAEKSAIYTNEMAGEVRMRELISIVFFTCLGIYLYRHSAERIIKKFMIFYFLLFLILLFTRNNEMLLLRYSYYVDFFAGFLILFAFIEYWDRFYIKIIFLILITTAPIRFFGVLSGHLYDYIDNSPTIVLNNVFDFLSYHN